MGSFETTSVESQTSVRAFGSSISENVVSGLEAAFTKLSLQKSEKPAEFPFALIPRQQNAIDLVTDTLCVFSTEVSSSGARRYFNAEPLQLWSRCVSKTTSKSLPRSHLYEVILSNRPVRLYMDLDFKNPPADAEISELKLANIVRSLVFHSLLDDVNSGRLQCSSGKFKSSIEQIRLIVQSATDKPHKISMHFIWPDLIFENNRAAGEFVRNVREKLLENMAQVQQDANVKCSCQIGGAFDQLCVQDAKQTANSCLFVNDNFLIDTGVYDRNRNWRLWRSAKRSGGLPLKLFKLFGFSNMPSTVTEEQIFMDSLVCPSPQMMEVIKASHRTALLRLSNNSAGRCSQHLGSSQVGECTYGTGPSPYPDVDRFLCDEVLAQNSSRGDALQLIRCWRFYPTSLSITYDISSQYRFCSRINRPHRSNRVYFTVSLISGEIYQRCHDTDCRNFRSFPPWLLPRNLLLSKN